MPQSCRALFWSALNPTLQSSAICVNNRVTMDTIVGIMFACCLLHNMILNNEYDVSGLRNVFEAAAIDNIQLYKILSFEQLTTYREKIKNEDTYYGLRSDLIVHLGALKSANMYG